MEGWEATGFDPAPRVVTALMCVCGAGEAPHDVRDTNAAEVSVSKGTRIPLESEVWSPWRPRAPVELRHME